MLRSSVKDIIAFAFYKLRCEMKEKGIDPFGNSFTDQQNAERVIQFFEEPYSNSYEYQRLYEDYAMFKSMCEAIDDKRTEDTDTP